MKKAVGRLRQTNRVAYEFFFVCTLILMDPIGWSDSLADENRRMEHSGDGPGFHLRAIRIQRCAHEGTITYSEQLRITTSDPA